MSSNLSKYIYSTYIYGFSRGIFYNYNKKDEKNRQLLVVDKISYTFIGIFMAFNPITLPFLVYHDIRNIELFFKNRKDEIIWD